MALNHSAMRVWDSEDTGYRCDVMINIPMMYKLISEIKDRGLDYPWTDLGKYKVIELPQFARDIIFGDI